MHPDLERLAEQFQRGRISRRELAWRASGVLGGLALTTFLVACGARARTLQLRFLAEAPAQREAGFNCYLCRNASSIDIRIHREAGNPQIRGAPSVSRLLPIRSSIPRSSDPVGHAEQGSVQWADST